MARAALRRLAPSQHQRGPQWQALPCWQPHWQDAAAGAAAWQPQVQVAPGQAVQAQRGVSVVWVFMAWTPGMDAGREWPATRILGTIAAAVLNEWADCRRMTIKTPDVPLRRRPVAGVGRVMAWPGGSLWIGTHFAQVQAHAHHAIQVSLALEGTFKVQAADWPGWRATSGMVVLPDRRHRFDAAGVAVAILFVEPNSGPGAALQARFAGTDVALLPAAEVEDAVRHLRAHYAACAPDDLLAGIARGAICRVAGDPGSAPSSDPRITAALAWMRARLAAPIRLAEVATAVHLSPGRFRHLFVAQTGTSLRAWLLWARVEQAMAVGLHGRSWTDAAQDAGFADAAHLTRTCRRMFGVAPTMLVPEGQRG